MTQRGKAGPHRIHHVLTLILKITNMPALTATTLTRSMNTGTLGLGKTQIA